MKSFIYELKEPVKVAILGKQCDAVSIEIFAPNPKTYNDVFIIESECAKAKQKSDDRHASVLASFTASQFNNILKVKAEAEKEEGDKNTQIKPLEVVANLISNGADIPKCFEALKNILLSGTKEKPQCIVDSVKLESTIFEQFSIIDLKEILGRYIQNFLDTSRNTSKDS